VSGRFVVFHRHLDGQTVKPSLVLFLDGADFLSVLAEPLRR
jgi:hypothetical protein